MSGKDGAVAFGVGLGVSRQRHVEEHQGDLSLLAKAEYFNL